MNSTTTGQCPEPTGIEALVCQEIASRQALGVHKYGVTVADNPLTLAQWLRHAFEEGLDLSIYLRRALAEIERQEPAAAAPAVAFPKITPDGYLAEPPFRPSDAVLPPRRVYISGPMTGKPGLNFGAFELAATLLRKRGFDVVSPVELNPDPSSTWVDCMRVDIPALCTCDEVALLPGWENSRGTNMEIHIARALEMPVRTLVEVLA